MNVNNFLKEIRKFGELEELAEDEIKEKNEVGYLFLAEIGKFLTYSEFEILNSKRIPFLITVKNEMIELSFIVRKEMIGDLDVTSIINEINAEIKYGKIYIDEEQDIIWRSTINIKPYNMDDFMEHIECGILTYLYLLLVCLEMTNE